jgi:hypothetical protein
MPLSSIIGRAIDLNTTMGVTMQVKAVAAAVELLRNDEEATDEARYVAATKLVRDSATKTMRRAANEPRQSSFFGDNLRSRYALDVDARVIKDTTRLSRKEWRRVIEIREEQLRHDTAHLDVLHEADRELAPIWDDYPDKNYGEVEAIYLRRRRGGEMPVAA